MHRASEFSCLDYSTTPFVEESLDFLIQSVDELDKEQKKHEYYQKNLQRQLHKRVRVTSPSPQMFECLNASIRWFLSCFLALISFSFYIFQKQTGETEELRMQPPSQLDSLFLTHQISNYCHQINSFVGQGVSKLQILKGLLQTHPAEELH